MNQNEHNKRNVKKLVGNRKLKIFNQLTKEIDSLYDINAVWNNGGKKWNYEYKYRKSNKTLCAFYFKENVLGFMIIFGKNERNEIEKIRNQLLNEVLVQYDNSETFHDGKWVMLDLNNSNCFDDLIKYIIYKKKTSQFIEQMRNFLFYSKMYKMNKY